MKMVLLEALKKFASTTIVIIMAVAMLYNIAVYIYLITQANGQHYYVQSTKHTTTQVIDFEELSVTENTYFLFRDSDPEARDADGRDGLTTIKEHVQKTCGGDFEVVSDLKRMTAIRDNLDSPFTLVSEIYVVALMFLCFYAACIWIPYQINEY
jgi:hypothetical protein